MKLHKNNGTHEEWELRNESIMAAFRGSDEWGEYLAGTSFEEALRKFIASAKGLASTFEEKEFEGLMQIVKGLGDETTDYTDLHRFGRGEK